MVTVPAQSFVAPVRCVVTAARRCMPSVCAVASSSSSARMTLTPCWRQRLVFPLMSCLRACAANIPGFCAQGQGAADSMLEGLHRTDHEELLERAQVEVFLMAQRQQFL